MITFEVWTSRTYAANPGGWDRQRTYRTFADAHELRRHSGGYPLAVVVQRDDDGTVRVVEGQAAAFLRDMTPR